MGKLLRAGLVGALLLLTILGVGYMLIPHSTTDASSTKETPASSLATPIAFVVEPVLDTRYIALRKVDATAKTIDVTAFDSSGLWNACEVARAEVTAVQEPTSKLYGFHVTLFGGQEVPGYCP